MLQYRATMLPRAGDPADPPPMETADVTRRLGEPIGLGEARPPGTEEDPLVEALRLIHLANERGLVMRLMGGLSIHVRCPEWTARVGRARRDIDLAARSQDRRELVALLAGEGYRPDRHYNALYGHKQLYFYDDGRERAVDILIDRLEMCHVLPFGERLLVDERTLPLAEMVLSKLQIVEINRKDLVDLLALFSEYAVADSDVDGINARRIVELTGNDWGWWRTVTGNIAKLEHFLERELRPGELDFGRPARHDPRAQLRELLGRIEAAPKSRGWKLRAIVGEKKRWYEVPEETEH